MSETPVIEHTWAVLSCNHRIAVPVGQPAGAQVSCEKCPKGKDDEFRVRRIKRLLDKPCPPPEMATPAEPQINRPGESVTHVTRKPPAEDPELIAQLEASIAAVTAQASDDRAERYQLAKVEHTALKAWETNGRKGDRPTSANLDAMNDDYAAGTKPGKSSKGRTKRAAWNPRRVMAGDAQKAAGNRRGPGVKVSDEDLAAYVRKVRSEHPESPRNDELEVGYWVEKLAISRPRWNAAWDAVDREESGQ